MTPEPTQDLARKRASLLLWRVWMWPENDRAAWKAALDGMAVDGPFNPAANWSPVTRNRSVDGYGRYLSWLCREGLLVEGASPCERIRRDWVSRYLADLRTFLAPVSIANSVASLAMAARALAPEDDWSWLCGLGSRLKHKARPLRDKRRAIRHTTELYELGLHIMDTAEVNELRRVFAAQRYMAGLMIALLAVRPLRMRNFRAITIGKSLRWDGSRYWLTFNVTETKTGRPIDEPIPDDLTLYLETYLRKWRPILLRQTDRFGGNPTHGCLWVDRTGNALKEPNVRYYIERYTARHFGTALWPHLFRDCLLTSLAEDKPDLMAIGPTLLGHATMETGERYYNQARMKDAGRQFSRAITDLRQSFLSLPSPAKGGC